MKTEFLAAALLAAMLLSANPLPASEPDACLACHGGYAGGGQPALGSLAAVGPMEGETLSLCPGVKRIRQEIYLTASRLAALSEALAELESRGTRTVELALELHRLSDKHHTLLRRPAESISGTSALFAGLRAELNREVGRPLWNLSQARTHLKLLGVALVVGLALVLAGLIGWRRRLVPPPEPLPLRLVREGRLPGQLHRDDPDPEAGHEEPS
ncbi:hypothetical protein AAU61_10670 [Desulfocarbo indianensis]|nr:hypothetical protein AAU61_10670 [Desulfocarbo indianensis]